MSYKYYDTQYTDSFGSLRTALGGVTQWTDRQIRNTGIVVPHIALNDVFSYNIQFGHNKRRDKTVHDFHVHFMQVDATTGTTTFKWEWGWFKIGDAIPDVLPNSGNTTITITAQYTHLYYELFDNITRNDDEVVSSILFVKVTRTALAGGLTGELALLGADCHFITDRLGSRLDTED